MSDQYIFHPFSRADVGPINDLQNRYAAVFPYRRVPAEVYLSPAYVDGQFVRCAVGRSGNTRGYAVFYPLGELAWVSVLVDPQAGDADELYEDLFDWLAGLARENSVRLLNFQLYPQEEKVVGLATRRGGQQAYGIFIMQRTLADPITDCPMPAGFDMRRLRMKSQDEREMFLKAHNACFPEGPMAAEDWALLVESPYWEHGICAAGFQDGELAGSVAVFWEPGSSLGSTEYIFTRPAYRGRGLARALIADALIYLREHGLQAAQLEVKALNEAALGLYRGLGYQVVGRTDVYQVGV